MLVTGPLLLTVLMAAILVLPLPQPQKAAVAFAAGFYAPGTYLMYAFGWNAKHAVGLFALPVPLLHHVLARCVVAFLLAAAPAGVLTAVLLAADPQLAVVPAAGCLFFLGVLSVPVMWLAMRTPHPIDVDLGVYARMQMLTWRQQVGGIVIVSAVLFLGEQLDVRILAAGGLIAGGVGLTMWPLAARAAARSLESRIPLLSEALRRV